MVSFKRISADLKVTARNYTRSRVGLFFALVFPIILMVLFGSIFSGSSGAVTAYVQNNDGGSPLSAGFVSALNSTQAVKFVAVPSSDNFTQYLLSHSTTDGIIIPQGFQTAFAAGKSVSLTIYGSPASTTSAIVEGVTNAVVNAFNLNAAHGSQVISLTSETIKSTGVKYIDFLIPGLIGFTILTSPMFALVNISSQYKRDKLFKQLSLTPLTKTEWLTSKVIWYMLLSVISFLLMTVIGTYGYGAQINYSVWIIPFIVLGPLFFVALGMLVGTVSNSVESAAVVGNLVTFPMMFLSGTFFPIAIMPAWLQSFAHVLPLFYVIEGLNNVMTYGNIGPALIDIGVLVVISILTFALAVRAFKWRED